MQKQLLGYWLTTTAFVKRNRAFFISFSVLFGVYFLWWLAFYPAIMTGDSFDAWTEATTFKFKNASPFLYAFIMSIMRVFGNTPASMALFQVTLFSTVIALFINYAWKKGINRWLLAATVAFFAIWPQFGAYNITIWKDVMYTIISLALGLAVFVFSSDKETRANNRLLLVIAVCSALVALFRYNGLIFLVVPAGILFVIRKLNLKRTILLTVVTVFFYLLIAIGLSTVLKVKKVTAMADGAMIKLVGSVYHLPNPNLNSFERSSFAALQPEEDWKSKYSCTSQNDLVLNVMHREGTNTYSPAIDPNPVEEANFHKSFFSALWKNPFALVKDRLCLADNMLGFRTRNNFNYADGIIRAKWQPLVVEASQAPAVKTVLKGWLGWTMDIHWSKLTKFKYDIFWAIWPMALLTLIAFLVAAVKRRFALGVYTFFILINLATVVALVPAIDYRYAYFVYVCAPLIPILYFLETKTTTAEKIPSKKEKKLV